MKINTDYTPDRWVVLQITAADVLLYKVFACWYGGYSSSDSWRINSGITKVTENENQYLFEGYSGSVYGCYKDSYGTNFYGDTVLKSYIDAAKTTEKSKIEILPEDTNWLQIISKIKQPVC